MTVISIDTKIFTLAHEIYHLLENEPIIKSEVALNESEENRDLSDDIADMFAKVLKNIKETTGASNRQLSRVLNIGRGGIRKD